MKDDNFKNTLKKGDKVMLLVDIKDAYQEVWHQKGDVLEVAYFTNDNKGVMFHSNLGVNFTKVRKIN